jgi:SNF2 family DNA or RNA helicase
VKFTPHPYQRLIAEHILKHPRCGVWAGMGMGKTAATLFALNILRYLGDNPTLIIAPLRVATSVWPAEARKWDGFKDIDIVPITGSVAERRRALQIPAEFHTINYDNLPWLVDEVGGPEGWRWKTVVADESTRLKSFRLGGHGGQRARALSKVAFGSDAVADLFDKKKEGTLSDVKRFAYIERFIELTGTPSPNGLLDLWGPLWFLDKGARLGRTFTAYTRRWFAPKHPFSQELAPFPHSAKEITAKVTDICLSVRAQDYFPLKEPIIADVQVELPRKARKIYDEMEREMYVELSTGTAEAAMAAAKTIKCLQIASGAVYLNGNGSYEVIHDEKLAALDDIIEEAAGASVLVAYHFKTDLIRLKAHYPHGRELGKDSSVINDWNAGKVPLLFVHPASAGHGLNLQDGGNIVAIFGHWWDLEQYLQVIERIGPVRQMQAGHDRPVYIYNIRAADTVDDLVIASRTDKRRVQDLLLDAARKRGGNVL